MPEQDQKPFSFEEIKDAVYQGIIASKESDSKFWGEQVETNKRIEKKLDAHLEEHRAQQEHYMKFYERVEPILKQHDDLKATKRTLIPLGKATVSVAAFIAAWEVVKTFIKQLFIHN